jgi:hypothetical protein
MPQLLGSELTVHRWETTRHKRLPHTSMRRLAFQANGFPKLGGEKELFLRMQELGTGKSLNEHHIKDHRWELDLVNINMEDVGDGGEFEVVH